jgi:hypothetical protein
MSSYRIVSHHLLRRRARRKALSLNAKYQPNRKFSVRRAERGPYRWYCVELTGTATPVAIPNGIRGQAA